MARPGQRRDRLLQPAHLVPHDELLPLHHGQEGWHDLITNGLELGPKVQQRDGHKGSKSKKQRSLACPGERVNSGGERPHAPDTSSHSARSAPAPPPRGGRLPHCTTTPPRRPPPPAPQRA